MGLADIQAKIAKRKKEEDEMNKAYPEGRPGGPQIYEGKKTYSGQFGSLIESAKDLAKKLRR